MPPGSPGDLDGDGIPDASDDCPTIADPSQADGDGDGLGNACDPCTGPALIASARLVVTHLATAPGDESVKLSGVVTVPVEPTLDPSTNGIRVIVNGADGGTILDQTVPGGTGWRTNGSQTLWKFVAPLGASGITKVRVRAAGGVPGRLKVQVQGKKLTLPPLTSTPLAATVVFDLPYAVTGQCGETAVGACALSGSGSAMRCR